MNAYIGLVMSICTGAWAAAFIRLAQGEGMPSLLVAALRLTVAALILTPFVIRYYGDQLRNLTRRDMILMSIAGFWLAIHFVLYVTSLEYASVLITSVLVTTSPLWVAILEAVVFKARPPALVWFGMVCAFSGGVIIALSRGSGLGSDPVRGGLMAAGGAVAVAVYLLIGRSVRARFSLIPYVWVVYGLGGIICLIIAAFDPASRVYRNPDGFFWVVMIAIFPQLIGHSGANYALRYFSATYVSIATQAIVVLSAFIAYFLFDEVPLPLQLAGSGIILLGVLLASIGQNRKPSLKIQQAE